MLHDGRAISPEEVDKIERDIIAGLYNDWDIHRMFETLRIQRRVLHDLFNLFHSEPLKLVSTAEPIRNSVLKYLKELVSMEDAR